MSGDQQLWDDTELFQGDPLEPDLVEVCPPTIIASLTNSQREKRVEKLVEQAHQIVDTAWELHGGNRKLVASCILYSGGNDSTVLAHMMRHRADYAIHANTTIGIEETRQFVRDTCAGWGLELLERLPPVSYRELVIERGYPGPPMHFKYFQRLKERCLHQVRRELVKEPRRERIMFIAGRRRAESKRRTNIPLYETQGSIIWASPIAMWTKLDMTTYRLMHAGSDPVPVNQVSELLHMSGECLCGAFAKPGELDMIRKFYPDTAAEIEALEREVKAAGHEEPYCTWGHGMGRASTKVGKLCTSCELPGQLDMLDSLE